MSPPRCPVPRPSNSSLERYFTCARIFSLSICGNGASAVGTFFACAPATFPCPAARFSLAKTHANPSKAHETITAVFFMKTPRRRKGLFLDAILEQILQLAHEFLYILEVHVHRCKSHVRDLVQLLETVHDHFADFGGGQLAFRSLVHHAFDFIHDGFQLGGGHGTFFACFQKSLQNLLPLEALAPPVLLDDHVRNFVNAFVGREPAAALQALAPPPDGVAAAAFPRINHFVVNVCAKRTLHWADSPCRAALSPAASFSCSAISRNFPSESPSWISNGTPAKLHAANVISHVTMAAAAAGSFSTPKIVVYARNEATCDPPPTPGSCTAEPTSVNAITSMASPKLIVPNVPPKLCDTQRYTINTRSQWATE